jgi:preprotein translocase SecE subunit
MKLLNSLVKGAIGEFRQINWPTRKETTRLVLTVLGFSIGTALILGVADFGFLQLVDKFIIKI